MSDVLGLFSAGIALLAAAAAVWQALEARRARTDAAASADDAATSAESLNKLASLAEAEANKVVPPWQIVHSTGSTFLLVNESEEVCRDVSISTDAVNAAFRPWTEPVDIHERSSKSFLFGSSGGPERDLRVVWHLDRHPTEMTWVNEIPRRPR